MVPLDVLKPLSSFLNASITEAVGNKAAVLRERGEPHQHSLVLERWHTITDGLGRFPWHNGPNHRADLVQRGSRGLRDACKVFVNVFRSGVASHPRTAIARRRSFRSMSAASAMRPLHRCSPVSV